MSAFNALGAAIYSKLSGGTALTALLSGGTASIYNVEAPFEASYDYVIFNVQGGVESNDSGHRVKDITLQVRAYSTALNRAGTIDLRCDTLLHGGTLNITGWTCVFGPVRAQDIEIVEYDEAHRPIYTRGGLYDIKIEKV
jgi:hypothetical protein